MDIRPIPEGRKRQVTFMKRKTGLLKKAMELSILCQCDMAVVIFNHNGKLYDYGSTDIHKTIRRFRNGGKGESEAYNSNEVRRAAPLTVARLLRRLTAAAVLRSTKRRPSPRRWWTSTPAPTTTAPKSRQSPCAPARPRSRRRRC